MEVGTAVLAVDKVMGGTIRLKALALKDDTQVLDLAHGVDVETLPGRGKTQ